MTNLKFYDHVFIIAFFSGVSFVKQINIQLVNFKNRVKVIEKYLDKKPSNLIREKRRKPVSKYRDFLAS